jgi:hypothetical protein
VRSQRETCGCQSQLPCTSEASPHQFCTRNAPTKAQRTRSNSNEKTAKSTNLIDILPLITVWLQVRVLSEPTTKSIPGQSPVCGRGGLSPQVSGKCLHRQSGLRASPLTPKIRQSKTAGSFLFVRRGTQSYDEFIAAVPLRPRLSMMLGMINTSDIFSIGENARACTSSGRRVT